MRTIITFILLLTFSAGLSAQDIKFDKKSGDFSGTTGVIAKLNSERVKIGKFNLGLGVGKNYMVTDATGATEYLGYMLQHFEDTLGGPTVWYYTMRCTPLNLTASRANFTGSMNTFKEVGELVVSLNLLQADGKMNETAMKDYFAANQTNIPAMLAARQDSLIKLVTVTSVPIKRRMREPIIANDFGKIGQDNAVIGYWELITTPSSNGIGSPTYHFVIRNLEYGIVSVSWIDLSGAKIYNFDNGKRKEEHMGMDLKENPIQEPKLFVQKVSAMLVRDGLL